MISTLAQFFSKHLQPGRRLSCALILALTIVLSAAVPAFAEPVRINQVVQTLTPQGITALSLDTRVSQDPSGKAPTQQNGPRNEKQSVQDVGGADSLLSGMSMVSDPQNPGVEVVVEGEVEGTICDCGEILIAAGGFPKWPLVFLTAVPFIFINDCDTCNPTTTPTPPPIPSPTPVPTPEPASLLLVGTGLLAVGVRLRQRFAKEKPTVTPEDE